MTVLKLKNSAHFLLLCLGLLGVTSLNCACFYLHLVLSSVCAVCMYVDPISPPPFYPASCIVVCVQCARMWTPFLPASCFVMCVCSVHVRGPHFTTPVLTCNLYCHVCAVCTYVDPISPPPFLPESCFVVCVQCACTWTPFHHPRFYLHLVLSCVCSVHVRGPRFTTPVFACILCSYVCAVWRYVDPVSPPPFLPASCFVVCVLDVTRETITLERSRSIQTHLGTLARDVTLINI